jgi:hypothetical protein
MVNWLPKAAITTTGNAGAATGTATITGVFGEWIRLLIDYHADAPATTDVTVTEILPDGTEHTVFTVTDNKTDVDTVVKVASVTSANVATTTFEPVLLAGDVRINVAGCDALTNAVVVRLQVEGTRK